MPNLPFLWSKLRPHSAALPVIGILLLLQILLTVLMPIPFKLILNQLVSASADTSHTMALAGVELSFTGGEALLLLTTLAFAIGLGLAATLWLQQERIGLLAFRLTESVRRELFEKLFTRKQSYLDAKKKVDLLGRVSGDASNLEILLAAGIPVLLRDIPMILVLVSIMFFLHFQLTLAFAACLPALYFIGRHFQKQMRSSSRQLRRKTAAFEEETHEALSSLAAVRSLQAEGRLHRRLLQRVSDLSQASAVNLRSGQGFEASFGIGQHFLRAGFLFLGSWAIFRAELRLGDLLQLLVYMELLTRHVGAINKFLAKLPKCLASVERLEDLHGELRLHPELSGDEELSQPLSLVFREVSFRHSRGKPIAAGLNLSFPRHQLVAVVGPSGSGKTTFSRLLNRLHDPVEGRVELNGRDLRSYSLRSLRSLVRVISQDTFLLAGTIRENLLLGVQRPVTEQELLGALAAVNAGFASTLPEGLETVVGEGGRQLSGGQAKRLHLARAFLDLESEVVVFDEPTSGLDPLSAKKVLDSIRLLSRSKSMVFWITHRMQEVHSAGSILFFQPGKNPVFSTHTELYTRSTLYRALMDDDRRSQEEASLC
jgi:ATP-binding cassette, subfamily B, bacterial